MSVWFGLNFVFCGNELHAYVMSSHFLSIHPSSHTSNDSGGSSLIDNANALHNIHITYVGTYVCILLSIFSRTFPECFLNIVATISPSHPPTYSSSYMFLRIFISYQEHEDLKGLQKFHRRWQKNLTCLPLPADFSGTYRWLYIWKVLT